MIKPNVFFLVLVIIELLLGILVAANFLALFPINFYEFPDLPKDVRTDITENVKAIVDEYKERVLRKEVEKSTEQVLYLRFHVQRCDHGEWTPSPFEPWPAGWIQYMCGSQATLDWCNEDMNIYKTSDKKMTLTDGKELLVGVSCYRTKAFNRFLHDNDANLLLAAGFLFPFICLIKLYVTMYQSSPQNENDRQQRPDVGPGPNRRFAAAAKQLVPPRHNIVNRRENFRNRRY